jgi:hypothetical protein
MILKNERSAIAPFFDDLTATVVSASVWKGVSAQVRHAFELGFPALQCAHRLKARATFKLTNYDASAVR